MSYPNNRQIIFDTVVNHLLSQGEKSLFENGRSAYKNPHGLSCAVGCLFTEEEYESRFEGWNVNALHSLKVLPKRLIPHFQLLSYLQRVHDVVEVKDWEEALREIAPQLKLQFPNKGKS